MPKSMNAMRLPGRKNRLPGCGSAWKKPSSMIVSSTARAPVTASTWRSRPARSSASTSRPWMPSTRRCTLVRSPVKRQKTSGTTIGEASAP